MKSFLRTSLLLGILGTLVILILGLIPSALISIGNNLSDTDIVSAEKFYHIAQLLPHTSHVDAILRYDEARLLYKTGKFEESEKILKQIEEKSIHFPVLHNLGNTLYRLGQKAKDPQETIQKWQEALDAYSGALRIEKDPETRANYDFVAKKLEDFKKQQKSQEKDQKQQESSDKQNGATKDQSGSGSQSQSGSGSSGENSSSSGKQSNSGSTQDQTGSGNNTSGTWSNQGNFNAVGGTGSGSENLSENQKKQLEQYLQGLKQDEKENRQFFQNQPAPNQSGISDMIQNFFGSDPFFRDDIGGDRKKDW